MEEIYKGEYKGAEVVLALNGDILHAYVGLEPTAYNMVSLSQDEKYNIPKPSGGILFADSKTELSDDKGKYWISWIHDERVKKDFNKELLITSFISFLDEGLDNIMSEVDTHKKL